jgi:hypothetical protein
MRNDGILGFKVGYEAEAEGVKAMEGVWVGGV